MTYLILRIHRFQSSAVIWLRVCLLSAARRRVVITNRRRCHQLGCFFGIIYYRFCVIHCVRTSSCYGRKSGETEYYTVTIADNVLNKFASVCELKYIYRMYWKNFIYTLTENFIFFTMFIFLYSYIITIII